MDDAAGGRSSVHTGMVNTIDVYVHAIVSKLRHHQRPESCWCVSQHVAAGMAVLMAQAVCWPLTLTV